jgi:hypothetical protein
MSTLLVVAVAAVAVRVVVRRQAARTAGGPSAIGPAGDAFLENAGAWLLTPSQLQATSAGVCMCL